MENNIFIASKKLLDCYEDYVSGDTGPMGLKLALEEFKSDVNRAVLANDLAVALKSVMIEFVGVETEEGTELDSCSAPSYEAIKILEKCGEVDILDQAGQRIVARVRE